MAATYTLISSNTLSGSAASVTFSSIPSTYTDLVLRASIRSDIGTSGIDFYIQPNSSTANDSATLLYGNGTSALSYRPTGSTGTGIYSGWANGTRTTNTFSSLEYYIPNYTSSTNKPMSIFTAEESNSTADTRISVGGLLWSNTTAISSLKLVYATGINFVSGSSFFLYGIKNA